MKMPLSNHLKKSRSLQKYPISEDYDYVRNPHKMIAV